MHKCPNCGQPTARTEDWACQWCGYPLLSKAYKKIPKTYKQLQEERKPELVAEPEPEMVAEPEPEMVAEPEPELIAEPEPEMVAEPEPELVVEPEPEPKPEALPGPKRKLPSGTIEVTVEELNSAYEANRMAAEAKFTNKILRVTGAVDKIVVRDHLDIRYILLAIAGKKGVWNVRCTFGKEHVSQLRQLATGQTVTVQGKYNGYERNILIGDCVLVG